MAHTKGKGSTKNLRDSQAKRLGVKTFGGTRVAAGAILIRQRGSRFYAGNNVGQGGDDTLFARTSGQVRFARKGVRRFDGQRRTKQFIHIEPVKV